MRAGLSTFKICSLYRCSRIPQGLRDQRGERPADPLPEARKAMFLWSDTSGVPAQRVPGMKHEVRRGYMRVVVDPDPYVYGYLMSAISGHFQVY